MTNRTSDFVVWNLPDSQPAPAGDIAMLNFAFVYDH
jgi:hypothetical protein